MAFIPAIRTARSTMLFQQENQVLANVLWFRFPGAITPTDLDALNTALHTYYTGHLKAQIGANCALTEILSVGQDTAFDPARSLIVSPGEAGTLGGTALPLNVSICVTLRTGFRGRSFRGRTYLPSRTTTDQNTPSSINGTQISNILTAVSWLLDAAHTAGALWSVVSHYTNKLPRPTAVVTPVDAISIDTPFDSSRRRLIGRGS